MIEYKVSSLPTPPESIDFTTIQAAVDAGRNQLDTDIVIRILGGGYNENVTIQGRLSDNVTRYKLKIIAENDAMFINTTGVSIYAFLFSDATSDNTLTIVGLTFINCDTAIQMGSLTGFSREKLIIEKSRVLNSDLFLERSNRVRLIQSLFVGVGFSYSSNANYQEILIGYSTNSTFINCTDLRISGKPLALPVTPVGTDHNYIFNCTIGICVNIYNDVAVITDKNLVFSSSWRFWDSTFSIAALEALPYSSQNDLASLNAYIATLGLNQSLTILSSEIDFQQISLDKFYFPTNEDQCQIDNELIGAFPYAISATVEDDEYTVLVGSPQKTSDYLELASIGTSAVIAFFFPEIIEARFIDRLQIQFEIDASAGEQLVESTQDATFSYDAQNYQDVDKDYKSGIIYQGSGDYSYFTLNYLTKKIIDCRVDMFGSTTASKLRVKGVTAVLKPKFSLLPQNRTVESIDQPSNVWIASGYDIERPESVKDAFSVPSKVEYTQAEMIAEAALPGSIIQIKYESDDPTPPIEIEGIIINDIQVKQIDTFGDE
jgi:hypothetical protein